MQDIKEFAVTMKLHNNLLLERRVREGLSPRELADAAGISYHVYLIYENLRYLKNPGKALGPYSFHKNSWAPAALKLAEYWKTLPEDLFPPAMLHAKTNTTTFTLSVADLPELISDYHTHLALPPNHFVEHKECVHDVARALQSLPPRERKILEERFFGDKTLGEVGEQLGVSKTRVQELEARALRYLRYGKSSARLFPHTLEE